MPANRNRRKREEANTIALDPIAMTLAIWLGVVVAITGFSRLVEDAQATSRGLSSQSIVPLGQASLAVPLGG